MTVFPRISWFQKRATGRPSLRMKRFMARYILYLEVFGYVTVSLIALAILSCFLFKVDDVIRIDGDPVAIKPRAETIKRPEDILVTQVFVRNYQPVKKGDPLVEIVYQPEWMSRYLIMRQMQSLMDEFAAPGQAADLAKKRIEEAQKAAREAALASVKKTGPQVTETEKKKEDEKPPLPVVPLSPDEEKARAIVQARLAAWQTADVPKAPRLVIRAPIDGIVLAPDDLSFKKVDADAEILKVVDLNDLRMTVKFKGQTVWDARTGQKARVEAIVPDWKKGTVFRGDSVPRGSFFWQKERVTSYSLVDPKVKDMVKETFKDRKITQRNDIPFNPTEVTDVEVNAALRTTPVPWSETAEGTLIAADAPSELELVGEVVEGKHLLTVQVADIAPDVTREVKQMVTEQVRGKVFAAPQVPRKEGDKVSVEHLRVDDVTGVQIIAKMKGDNTTAKGDTDDLKREAKRNAVRGASLDRLYEATLKIPNPPDFLKVRVLELMQQGKEVKAKAEIITGRRPVAFLLLKR